MFQFIQKSRVSGEYRKAFLVFKPNYYIKLFILFYAFRNTNIFGFNNFPERILINILLVIKLFRYYNNINKYYNNINKNTLSASILS